MSTQTKRDKAAAKAAAVVDAAIDTATQRLRHDGTTQTVDLKPKAAKPKRGELPPEFAAMADQVKALRAGGMAWWQIGYKLGLPGSADTVAKGKGGAAYARKVWKSAFGEVPRTQVRNGSRSKKAEKNTDVREMRETAKAERVVQVRAGQSVIAIDKTDEEVLAMIDGRMLTWSINLADMDHRGDEFYDTSAAVFQGTVRVTGLGVDRAVRFLTFDPNAPIEIRGTPGVERIVRVSAIHTIGRFYGNTLPPSRKGKK